MPFQTVVVPHLGGTTASYWLSSHDPFKPTLVLVNSFGTSVDLYKAQFADAKLTGKVNLLAIDVLGHGNTRTKSQTWTYWDTATINLQVVDKLGLKGKVFALGTSQGGFIVVRMALLEPEKISGIVILGSSLDYESDRTRKLGCWDANAALTTTIDALSTTSSTPNHIFDDAFCDFLIDTGFGSGISQADRQFWREAVKVNWGGDEGRKRARMSAICLRDRDGLLGRLFDITCPVLWAHGTADVVYSVANAEEEIKLLTNSSDVTLQVVQGGQHYLSYSHPKEINVAVLGFVTKHGSRGASRI